jgi:gluconokinase
VTPESPASARSASGAEAGKTAVVVMGVSGSGKTTVADLLADRLGWRQAEADDFHPPENVAKMRAGTPLTDADRRPWLAALRDWISASDGSVVITCSALRKSYRDVLVTADAKVRFLHLDGDPELILERMSDREGHFMPTSLLQSQLATLEPLQPDEPGTVVDIDQTPEQIAADALKVLGLR